MTGTYRIYIYRYKHFLVCLKQAGWTVDCDALFIVIKVEK